MKRFLIAIAYLLCVTTIAKAQQQHPNIGCIDKTIKLQAEDYQLSFAKQGMTVYRDAMVNMNSQEPFPITVSLTKGKIYQFVFIGSKESQKIIMELFDEKDKKIAQKTVTPELADRNSNCILYSFIPSKTDLYLIVLSQVSKSKNMCGSFTILEQGNVKKEVTMSDSTIKKQPVKTNPRFVPVNK